MSDAKPSKKSEPVSKKSETTKKDVTKTDVAKTETTTTEAKSVDSSASKSVSPPKSASQSSISHFSSVSTPQYRSGWNDIFGGESEDKTVDTGKANENNFPQKLNILDYDIDLELRNALDAAFNGLAKQRGINLEGANRSVRFEYYINCEIKEK
ncbi:MAG: hypothetical protein OSB27_10520 [Planktomarina sp.]|nr:hypothetical protein [Planktomarina sp.]MDT2050437.1 hypothetical protein [Planktomarina sp.]